jgi:6-phosphogluconolactonase
MRMKLNKTSQLLLAATASLLAAGLATACSTSRTVDYVYATSAKASNSTNYYGQIDIYAVDAESGYMSQIAYSPYPSMGRNPVASAVSSDYGNLYVANKDDHTVVRFVVGSDGKIYPTTTKNTTGAYPMALAVAGDDIYVLNTYKVLGSCSTNAPCSGSITVFPLSTSTATNSTTSLTEHGDLESALYNSDGNSYLELTPAGATSGDIIVPEAITAVTSGSYTYIYVAAYDSTAGAGYLLTYGKAASGTSPCASTYTAGTLCLLDTQAAGVQPSAIAASADGSHLYVADASSDLVLTYSVSAGLPTAVSSWATGSMPSAIAVDPTGKHLYVANKQDSSVTAISLSSGVPSQTIGSYGTGGTQPVSILIDPSQHKFLFTANFVGNSVSNLFLSSDGSLYGAQDNPYAANSNPTSVVAVPR